MDDPTLMGTVESVSGSQVSVALAPNAASGLTYVGGHGYRTGQIGNFVRIAIGLVDLYGVIAQIGAGAVPENLATIEPHGHRWMTVQLVGEALPGGGFERGLSEYPTIGDRVHLLTEDDLQRLYGEPDELRQIRIGQLAGGGSIAARIDLDRLVTRHSAVVGATGSGKSTTVARLLSRVVEAQRYPGARVMLFDLHGEYASALGEHATVFTTSTRPAKGREHLYVPFWALPLELLLELTMGPLEDKQLGVLNELVVAAKRAVLAITPIKGLDPDTVTADTPVPFSLKDLWFELHKREHGTYTVGGPIAQTDATAALELDEHGVPIQPGSADLVIPPRYRAQVPQSVILSARSNNLRRQTDLLAQRLRDPRYAFLLRPGPFEPTSEGKVDADLDLLLSSWLGGDRPIALLDLSVAPTSVLNPLVGAIVNIAYDALLWGRALSEGGRERPLLMVFEEAHSYLKREQGGLAGEQVRRVVREGRKYGVGAMVVSQRPSELDATVLSQCGTLIALRLSNAVDRQQVTSTSTDSFQGLLSGLPILRTGEAIVVGEAVGMPMRVQVDALGDDRRPDSHDPPVVPTRPLPGGWTQARLRHTDYAGLVEAWRTHNARARTRQGETMERQPVSSSAIASVGYDETQQTLEVEFVGGNVYQYYGVPENVHAELVGPGSVGTYFSAAIRDVYPYTRL